jgi:Putative auto-transporter adhesin, head GIN domain
MRTLLLLAVAASMSGCMLAGKMGSGVKGSGTVVKKTLSFSAFSEIEHDTVGEMVVTVGGAQKVEIETDDNILPLLENDVKGDLLKLSNKESINPTKLVYHITVPSLDVLTLEGVGSAEVKGLKGDKFKTELSGVGSVNLAGEVSDLEAEVTGVGSLEAEELKAKTGTIKVTGVGSAKVNVTESLTARCSGVGGIQYKGSPKVDKKTEGIGDISPLN